MNRRSLLAAVAVTLVSSIQVAKAQDLTIGPTPGDTPTARVVPGNMFTADIGWRVEWPDGWEAESKYLDDSGESLLI